MKVIFCLNHFLPDRLAGIEIYTLNLAQQLQSKGLEVVVLIPFFDSFRNDSYVYGSIRVVRYSETGTADRGAIMGNVEPGGVKAFIEILEDERPDVLHFQELAAGRGVGNFHVKAAAALGINIMVSFHLSTYSCYTGNLIFKDGDICDGIIREKRCTACAYHDKKITGIQSGWLQLMSDFLFKSGIDTRNWNSKFGTALGFPFVIQKLKNDLLQLANLCDRIIVCAHWYQRILQMNGVPTEKITYCKHGIHTRGFTLEKRKCVIPIRVIFIGRISKFKGVHLLIEAIQLLPHDAIQVDIFGPVTEESYGETCKQLSNTLENINWMGTIEPQKVVETIAKYDLLCLPSTFSEMSPLVIQEAYAAGVPVLASNVYGNAEQIIDGESGWLFQYKSVSSLVEKFQMLIKNPELVDIAKVHIPQTRSYNEMAGEHISIYKEVLHKKNTSA